jgi:hypothetical protein
VHVTLEKSGDTGLWHVTVTLEEADRAALDALRPSAAQLCAAAQHALGMAAIDSLIEIAHWTIVVRTDGAWRLAFVGEAALWWVANALTPVLRAGIERLAAQIMQSTTLAPSPS